MARFLDSAAVTQKIFREVNAIATLTGANYLTASERIWISGVRPDKISNPLVTIKGSRFTPNQSQIEDWQMDIKVFVDRRKDGSADATRFGLVTGEIIQRLDRAVSQAAITITGGAFKEIHLDTDSGILSDAAHPTENYQMLRFRLFGIKT